MEEQGPRVWKWNLDPKLKVVMKVEPEMKICSIRVMVKRGGDIKWWRMYRVLDSGW